MKFSVWPNMDRPPAEVLDLARFCDGEGWFGIWYADHYMPNTGTEEVVDGDVHECWAMLPAIAAVTEKVRLGSLVAPTSVHHPAVLANRAVTIDHLSGGRLVLGLGAGWQINEHRAYGIELEAPGPRVTRFEEAIQIVRSLFENDRTSFEGSVYRITDGSCGPKPVQSPLPILVGTKSRRMLRIAARYAQEWNAWGNPNVAGEARQGLLAACEAVGTDPASMWSSVQALVVPTDDPAKAAKASEGDWGTRTIAGSDGELVEALGAYAGLGFDEFIVPDFTLGRSPEERFDTLRRLKADVFSQVA